MATREMTPTEIALADAEDAAFDALLVARREAALTDEDRAEAAAEAFYDRAAGAADDSTPEIATSHGDVVVPLVTEPPDPLTAWGPATIWGDEHPNFIPPKDAA